MSSLDQDTLVIEDLSEEILNKKDKRRVLDGEIKELESEIQSYLKDYYTISEAASRLRVSPRTVFRNKDRYTNVHHGGKWYLRADQIQEEAEIKRRLQRGV